MKTIQGMRLTSRVKFKIGVSSIYGYLHSDLNENAFSEALLTLSKQIEQRQIKLEENINRSIAEVSLFKLLLFRLNETQIQYCL
jgi:hypothetical protein